ncbi:CUB and sushi domain-containing protein 3-like isoform X5 [Haliotis rubra]|uniref:CUB and sushi domain-containing protein 3-like isoform X5 n=1 Tax=Haliotis rubra TaxID=36100 RepID=UPI001EE5D969|nr:CUB and sushi domain-containing protein 3-like isoform X5 [Haliotis rubra]
MSYILIRWTIVAQVVAAHKAKPVDCGSPTPLSGMVVPVLPVNTSLGSTCHYVCADGFTLIRGSGNSSCEADGDWSTPSLQCSEECGKAVPAPNTYLQTENGGQTLRYSCFYSYILLSGDLTRRCEKGHLTGQAPACQLDCGSPLTSNRTASFVSPYTTAGSTVKYTCPNGRANAESTSLCDPEIGSWDAEDKCYGKLASTDIQGITQSSLAFQHDVITSSNATNSSTTDSDKALYGAGNAIDTVYGVYLGQGHCSSTAAEHKPYVIITLTDMMAVYRVVVTLPNDTYDASSAGVRLTVSMSLDKEAKKICMEWSPGEDALEVIHLDCLQHPVGQYLLIKASFLAPRDFRLCDVWVGGRIFDKPYECVTESGYKGSVNVTVMGIPCQRWDAQSPHTHTSADARLPDYSLTEAANRCRSTTDRPAPWCYTTDPSVRSVLPGGQL